MLLREESVSTRDQQEKSTSACPVMPYWAVLGAARQAQGSVAIPSLSPHIPSLSMGRVFPSRGSSRAAQGSMRRCEPGPALLPPRPGSAPLAPAAGIVCKAGTRTWEGFVFNQLDHRPMLRVLSMKICSAVNERGPDEALVRNFIFCPTPEARV